MNNMETDGYSFEYLQDRFRGEYLKLLTKPYNLNPSQAAGFLYDQYDILRLKYTGFKETLEIIIADLLIQYSCYSAYFHPSALVIIDKNLLPELWRKNDLSEELFIKRTKFLNQLKDTIKEIR